MDLGAVVARAGAIREVANGHATSAPTAQDDALEQGGALAHGPTSLLGAEGAIIVQPLLDAEELLPGDVAGMGVAQDDRPRLWRDLAGATLQARRLPGPHLGARSGATVDVGPGVGRVVEDGQDPAVAQRFPEQLAIACPAPVTGGDLEVLGGEVADDRQRRAGILEEREDEPDRLLDRLVRVQDHATGRIVDEPGRRLDAQGALAGFLELAAQQAGPQPVQLSLGQGALEAEQEAIIVLAGVVDAVLVDDQGLGQGTQLQQPLTVAGGARQARRLQAP